MKQERALVIDDDLSVRVFLTRLLKRCGWEVFAAGDAAGASKAFEAGKYELGLIDVDLGGGVDGLAIAREFHRRDPRPAIVMMLGDPANKDRVLLEDGPDAFLAKPFTIDEFQTVLFKTFHS